MASPSLAERERIEAALRHRVQEFSLPALLDLLELLGYRRAEIEYRGHLSRLRHDHLIEDLSLSTLPVRRAIITVNLGLLGARSPLPSYFLQALEEHENNGLVEFLGYFDHHLLRRRIDSLYPERDRSALADWEGCKEMLLKLLGRSAPTTLHWLFQRAFPELGVVVRRGVQMHLLPSSGVQMGVSTLGSGCAFGSATNLPIGSLEVTLSTEESHSPAGEPWATEAARRLREVIWPVLGELDVYLSVFLVFLDHHGWASLERDHYLGYDPIRDERRGRGRVQQVTLFSGGVSEREEK